MTKSSSEPAIFDIDSALQDLGVTDHSLAHETRDQLDRDGFALLPGVVTSENLRGIQSRLRELTQAEGTLGGLEVGQESGTNRLSDLINKGPQFDVCFTHPTILAAVRYVIDEFKVSSISSRAALPGQGRQALHADWPGGPLAPGDFQACNTMWILDDFTELNGATRIVPGSHRWGVPPGEALDDPLAPHPDERLILAPAGSLLIFNAHVWHGGTQNRSPRARRALHAYFTRRANSPQVDQRRFAKRETIERLSAVARYLLDI